MPRVVIVQEYVPHYRRPFFEKLASLGRESGVEIIVAAGDPTGGQTGRGDGVSLSGQRILTQKEFRLGKRRVTIRKVRLAVADADFVVLEQARRNFDAYYWLARRNRKFPVALWGHGRDYTQHSGVVGELLRRWLTARADWFFAYTEGGGTAVASQGYPGERVTVVNNSVDTTDLVEGLRRLSDQAVIEFRRRHDLRNSTALFLGGLDASKRLDFLLDSAAIVHENLPDFRLVIAGDGVERERITSFAANNTWCVYLGQVHGPEKWSALAAADVLTMPGRVGLVAVDSFAAGLPIITTNWPLHAPEFEYLIPGKNGLVVEDDIHAYARELENVLVDVPMRQRLSSHARDSAEHYSVEKMAKRYLDGIRQWMMHPRKSSFAQSRFGTHG